VEGNLTLQGAARMDKVELVREAKIHRLLPDCDEDRRLEASGVVALGDQCFVIFDNMGDVARIDTTLTSGGEHDWLVTGDDTIGIEDIAYNERRGCFYLLVEATPVARSAAANDEIHRAEVLEYDHRLARKARYHLPFDFASDNKGFEGLAWVEREGEDHVLALCEGNRCQGGSAGREPGHGTIQVFRRATEGWKHVTTLAIPATARFVDYASLDIRDGRVVVLSQESAQLWVGRLREEEWAFVDDGAVHVLPRAKGGRVSYCNAEGVAWLTDDRVAIVSDRKKKDAAKRCGRTDQSIHIFALPPVHAPAATG
jgi:hypothetical protein